MEVGSGLLPGETTRNPSPTTTCETTGPCALSIGERRRSNDVSTAHRINI